MGLLKQTNLGRITIFDQNLNRRFTSGNCQTAFQHCQLSEHQPPSLPTADCRLAVSGCHLHLRFWDHLHTWWTPEANKILKDPTCEQPVHSPPVRGLLHHANCTFSRNKTRGGVQAKVCVPGVNRLVSYSYLAICHESRVVLLKIYFAKYELRRWYPNLFVQNVTSQTYTNWIEAGMWVTEVRPKLVILAPRSLVCGLKDTRECVVVYGPIRSRDLTSLQFLYALPYLCCKQEDIAEFEMLRARASSTSSGANRANAAPTHATPAPSAVPTTRQAEAQARDRRVRGGRNWCSCRVGWLIEYISKQ
jgi:hypothetical protein